MFKYPDESLSKTMKDASSITRIGNISPTQDSFLTMKQQKRIHLEGTQKIFGSQIIIQ